MAVTHATATRNALADQVDAQVNAGTMELTGDVIITTGGATPTTLVTIDTQDPAFGVAAGGDIVMAGLPLSASASATGTAAEFEVRNRDNAQVFKGSVTATAGGGDMELDNTSITSGQTVQIDTFTYSAPP